ncbi:MAG: outer membrane protein assembly factor BamA, partial [Bacteroidaceae bacterium]|nr:outer membrane protein assembly factor BamA [Bacteroidaceae bacterium]
MSSKLNDIKTLVLVMCLLCVGITGRGQDLVKVNPQINYTTSPTKYIIGGINIVGGDNFDHNILLGYAGLHVGDEITIPKADGGVTLAIQNLWKQGLFSDVSVTADSIVGEKIYMTLTLVPRPTIAKINYHGLKKSERDDLDERMGLKEGSQVSTNILDRAKIIISKYFDEKGYKNAEIEILQRDDSVKQNQVVLDLYVDKNEKVKVHKIYFSGVDEKKIKKLKSAMKKTKEVRKLKNFFRSKKFIDEKYAEDKQNIINKYNAWGYRDAYITSDSIVQ